MHAISKMLAECGTCEDEASAAKLRNFMADLVRGSTACKPRTDPLNIPLSQISASYLECAWAKVCVQLCAFNNVCVQDARLWQMILIKAAGFVEML